jgi:Na+/H+-dicarboxylate symporter
MYRRHLTLLVIAAGFAAWLLATLAGDPGWTETETPPFGYEIILLLKQAFLGLLKMLIAPVIFFSLMSGIVGLGDATRLRRLGITTLAYYLATTAIAIVIGLVIVMGIHPWTEWASDLDLTQFTRVESAQLIDPTTGSFGQLLISLADRAFVNPFSALAELNILGIVVNAILLGIALLVTVPRTSPVIVGLEHLTQIVYRVLSWVVLTMPVGVFAIVFDLTLRLPEAVLEQLLYFVLVVLGATLFHGLVVLPLIALLVGGKGPIEFLRGASRPILVALTTSSSSATLPVTMKAAEEQFRISSGVRAFVLPLGATMNMDGTALFEGIAAVFLAHLFGIDLTPAAMTAVFLMAMIASIGAPGMPSGSMAGMQMVLLAVGIPLEAIGILLLVERPLDAVRTAVNVEGDLVGAVTIERLLSAKSDTGGVAPDVDS